MRIVIQTIKSGKPQKIEFFLRPGPINIDAEGEDLMNGIAKFLLDFEMEVNANTKYRLHILEK